MRIVEQTPERLVIVVPKSEGQSGSLFFGGFVCLCALVFAVQEAESTLTTSIALVVLVVAFALTVRSVINAPRVSITLDRNENKIEALKVSRNGQERRAEPLSELDGVRFMPPIDPGDGTLRFEFSTTQVKKSSRSFPEIAVKDEDFDRIEKWIERMKTRH